MEILQIIEELESVASSATRVPGLRKKVMVDQDRLGTVVDKLRRGLPSDIQEAREVLKQKESIVNGAMLEARRIREAADGQIQEITQATRQEHAVMVDENSIVTAARSKAEEIHQQALQDAQQITQDAQRRAYVILDEADANARARREGADQYARETLYDLEERLAEQLGQVRRGIDALGLNETSRVVKVAKVAS